MAFSVPETMEADCHSSLFARLLRAFKLDFLSKIHQAPPSFPTSIASSLTLFKLTVNEPYTISRIPTPKPKANELLVKVACASLCHSDLEIAKGLFPAIPLPVIASHEAAGVVVGWGADVQGWKGGERVMCHFLTGLCGKCDECRAPDRETEHFCSKQVIRGVAADGFFAEFVAIDMAWAVPLPDSILFDVASPLSCAGRTIYRAVSLCALQAGQTLALIGSGGGLGHIGIQIAKALGLRVIGVDARDAGLTLSRELGADLVLDARTGQEAKREDSEVNGVVKNRNKDEDTDATATMLDAVRKFTVSAEGADATINLSGHVTALATACQVTRMHGTVVQVAVASPGKKLELPWEEIVMRDVRIRGSLVSTHSEAVELVELVAKTGIQVEKEVVKGLGAVNGLMNRAQSGELVGKGVVVVNAELLGSR